MTRQLARLRGARYSGGMDTTSGPDEIATGGRLTVDLGALAANWRLLRDRAGAAECAAVVKADAYGLGIPHAVPALRRAGAKTFFVAHPFEAAAARKAAPDATIHVLNGLAPGGAEAIIAAGARPVLGSMAEVDEWDAAARAAGIDGAAALHVDTGMNRLGMTHGETQAVAARLDRGELAFRPALIMSHLACADEPEHPLNTRQLEAFRAARALFPEVPTSLANSAATLAGGAFAFDLCRPGVALYGANPLAGPGSPMAPVVTLEARIVQLRDVAAGDTVGYGAAETARRPSRIAILSAGYADGYLRRAGSADGAPGAEAVVAGRRCPLFGRVSMDLIAVDVTGTDARRGDWATLIGRGIGVDEVAARAGTIGYEILTGLGRRHHRIYRGG